MTVEAAAWVPDDDPERPWDDAADLAVEWLLDQAGERGQAPLLVTPTQSQWSMGAESIQLFAQRYEATTPRSNHASFSNRPVLVYVPDYDVMHLALRYARGSAIAVVETVSSPLVGWASAVGALDLTTGEPTRPALSDAQRKTFDRIEFNGNNGWTRGFGADSTARILRSLRDAGDLDKELLLGYMVAKGKHGRAIDRLVDLIDKT
jgi:hypothetical protein